METSHKIPLGVLAAVSGAVLLRLLVGKSAVDLLQPAGPIAYQEIGLIGVMAAIMLLVALPTLVTLFVFGFKYGAGNRTAGRGSHPPGSALWLKTMMWLVPLTVVSVFSLFIWRSAHALDPYRPLRSAAPPVAIQVVSLRWKWLFIYPGQHIATVNFVEFPANAPVHFYLTADSPMSTFWIPRLGTQIYAMNGMVTQLNVMASSTGDYEGKDTEINGSGYADMDFAARAVSPADFDAWVRQIQQHSRPLSPEAYDQLAAPSENNLVTAYAPVQSDLFDRITMKFMAPSAQPMAGMPATQ